MLQSYFRSGWAFLIPYLAAYLLYAWLKWPVNPVAAGSSPVDGGQLAVSAIGALPSTVPPSTAHSLLSTGVPCLLHVYWFLHALHLVLGALALRAWWKGSSATEAGATDDSENTANRAAPPLLSTVSLSDNRSPSTVPLRSSASSEAGSALIWRFAPWLLLALLFYIPGTYLEYPADTWEHFSRVNEWSACEIVTQHFVWIKSSYFIPYSLLRWATGLQQIFWLDFYYTGMCMLLCWQYYRLGKACGLGERTSMLFVLLQALLLGNNIFSFYRYYAISSSIYAQLGAVALTRITLNALRSGEAQDTQLAQRILLLFARYSLLLALIAFNHIQGLGIAAFGVAAVIVWRLIEWRSKMVWWFAAGAVVMSMASVIFFPRHAFLDNIYRPQGWLTAWYGFNLIDASSPSFDRSIAILGMIGLFNLICGLFLLRRNCIIGWLTCMPAIALCLPFVAIPLANSLAGRGVTEILTFHRMLLAIPSGLAICTFGANSMCHVRRFINTNAQSNTMPLTGSMRLSNWDYPSALSPYYLISFVACLIYASSGAPYFSRIYNAWMRPPADLAMNSLIEYKPTAGYVGNEINHHHQTITPIGVGNVLNSIGMHDGLIHNRSPITTAVQRAEEMQKRLVGSTSDHAWPVMVLPPTSELFTPLSTTGFLSNHWPPHVVALGFAGGPEIEGTAHALGLRQIKQGRFTSFMRNPE